MKLPDAPKCQCALPALRETPRHSVLVETLLTYDLLGKLEDAKKKGGDVCLCQHTLSEVFSTFRLDFPSQHFCDILFFFFFALVPQQEKCCM